MNKCVAGKTHFNGENTLESGALYGATNFLQFVFDILILLKCYFIGQLALIVLRKR